MKERKFLNVTAIHNENGIVKPVIVQWMDGKFYKIENATYRDFNVLSNKKVSIKYSFVINEKNEDIFYEFPFWYVEGK